MPDATTISIMNKVYSCLLVAIVLSAYPALAADKFENAAKSKLQPNGMNYFFPFHDCIVATIKKIHYVHYQGSDCIFLTADITKVLRGSLRKGVVVFAIRGDIKDLKITGATLEKHMNQQAVLAFSPYLKELLLSERMSNLSPESALLPKYRDPGAARAIWISRVFIPLCGKNLSDADVKKAVGPIEDTVYPYGHCVVASIVEVVETRGDTVEVAAQVNDVLFGRFYKEGEKVKFLVPRSLLPKRPINRLNGCKCVWEFGGTWPGTEEPTELKNGHCPFPGQVFTAADIELLKARLAEEKVLVARRQAALLSCLQKRWTVAKIRDFCRPENRWNTLTSRLDYSGGDDIWSGQLYPDLYLGGRKMTLRWKAEIVEGIPEDFEVWAEPEKQSLFIRNAWRIDFSWFSDWDSMLWTDDQFQKYRLTYSIDNFVMAYRIKHRLGFDSGIFLQWFDRPSWETKLLFDRNKKLIGYSCPLANGQLLQAKLNVEGSIKEILINGKEDPEWTTALTELDKSLDQFNSVP